MRIRSGLIALMLIAGMASAEDGPDEQDKLVSGMSIVGNDEAPKSLVIVPWKSSELGDRPGFSNLLDDGRRPVDREVFRRELHYYQLRTASQESERTIKP